MQRQIGLTRKGWQGKRCKRHRRRVGRATSQAKPVRPQPPAAIIPPCPLARAVDATTAAGYEAEGEEGSGPAQSDKQKREPSTPRGKEGAERMGERSEVELAFTSSRVVAAKQRLHGRRKKAASSPSSQPTRASTRQCRDTQLGKFRAGGRRKSGSRGCGVGMTQERRTGAPHQQNRRLTGRVRVQLCADSSPGVRWGAQRRAESGSHGRERPERSARRLRDAVG